MASSTTSSSVPETVFEEGLEFSEANNILLKALMEETQEDEQDQDLYYANDDRLMSMIQSLEAEISISSSSRHQRYDDDDIDHHHQVGQVDGQDCSMSLVCTTDDWMDMDVASASSSSSSSPPFDEDMIMSAWSPCATGGDDCNNSDYSDFYYRVLLENFYLLPQEAISDVVF